MNPINKKFEKFIISEAKKFSKKENINLHLKEDKQVIHECDCGCDCCNSKKLGEPEFIKIEFEAVSPEEFEAVSPEEFLNESKEAKVLSKELDRMKQLLNFNNPLLKR
tara:strand:+ start:16 stop:339 length:324 start_codon:yes stop_codon:yes gene_type:complete